MIVLVSQTIDGESTDRRYEEIEEEVNILKKLIMDKDNELAQVHEKLGIQESELSHHQQQKEKLQQQYDDMKKTHKLEMTKINNVLSRNSEKKIVYEIITKH